ncbi:hypothetical protein [Streptomyces sp. NPDC093589]|uniref:hypothetical protein n=1 Tax=Streptomyces sp. NPDC093589 TaxID=3366043 RepID=UPI0038127F31
MDAPVRDIIANFSVRPGSAAAYGYRNSGAPLAKIARWVHADLYGLPLAPQPDHATLRELADKSYEALDGDERQTVLDAAIDQLPDLAALLDRAALWAERDPRTPNSVARQLSQAAAVTRQMTNDLTQASRAFNCPAAKPTPASELPVARPTPAPTTRPARR